MIISFVNQKGGVGKTTSAINIAASLKRRNYKIGFIDADPQGSATHWHAVEDNSAFEVLHHPEPISRSEVDELSQKYDYLVIDAPPAFGNITKSILAVADLSIIPLSPSSLDIWSCKGTLEMVDEAREENPELDVKLLINRKIPGTRVGREARDSLAIFDMDILNSELCQRVAYIDAMTSGVSVMQYAPNSKAADEVESLCDEITLPQAQSEPQIQEPYQYAQPNDVEGEKPEPYSHIQPQEVDDEKPVW
ncbi:MAG: ParA family partition ATPase [Desulfobacterales bacterium]|jgi:chromosome partitioning protein